MPQVVTAPSLALLHAGGWDEVTVVGAGLVIAWAIIWFTGKKEPADEGEAAAMESNHGDDA